MKALAYYNEHDRQKAATLRNLIEEGAIAPGVVDDRPIQEVQPDDVKGFCQAHFFAGGGVWSYTLRLAGWPDDRPVWTGSCPCGPFSKAGLKKGFDDPRHLWPEWLRLIGECRPDVLFGEQSDEADAWLDLVSADLEGRRYAIGSAIIPAAGFGGFHGRHRIGFVADADNAEWWSERAPWHDGWWPKTGRVKGDGHARYGDADGWLADALEGGRQRRQAGSEQAGRGQSANAGRAGGLADANGQRRSSGAVARFRDAQHHPEPCGHTLGLGDPYASRLSDAELGVIRRSGWWPEGRAAQQSGHPSGTGVDWLLCRDSRWRPVESGTCPLVDETPARMGRLRLYGDAIDAEAFANFIGAHLDGAPAWGAAA